jgi:hypothetical protein
MPDARWAKSAAEANARFTFITAKSDRLVLPKLRKREVVIILDRHREVEERHAAKSK